MSEATRWTRVKEIFDAAAACRAEDRAAVLRELCGDDRSLQAEVESLLSADAGRKSMFDPPVDPDLRGRVFGAVAGALGHRSYALAAGSRVGPFEIIGSLGRGGMGEVYRARDTKLNRDVALKILPETFAGDPDRLARFGREAQLLASLNHPNIAHIYGLEDAHPAEPGRAAVSPALVLELVEGPTLADQISKGPMPLADALPIARQIAEALETAHEQGVVHRDLKPANVKLRADGLVKVLDFGLARALTANSPSSSADAMESPTMTSPGALTESRVILGTVPYMSPEQARGKVVDKRADIWAFGCVLFEMLTGRRPFDGETSSDTIAAILERQPDWDALPNATPASIRLLLQRCLEKDPKRRLRDIGDARIEIEHLKETAGSVATAARPAVTKRWTRRPVRIALAVGVLAAAAGTAYFFTRSRSAERLEYTRITDFADAASAPSLSPDGRMVTFKRGGDFFQSPGQIYVKLLPDGESIRLTNDNLVKLGPVFTPDSTRIAYTQVSLGNWETWTVPMQGGQPTRLLPNAGGLTWIGNGRVLFSEIKGSNGIHMGIVTTTEVRAESRDIYFPEHERAMAHFSNLSPDRKWVLVVEMDGRGFQPCRIVPFDGSSSGRQVGPQGACTAAAWSPGGEWMYFTANVDGRSHLWRHAFPDGTPEQLTFGPNEEQGVAVAPDGSLITSVGTDRLSAWIHNDAGERQISTEGVAAFARLSRDGRRVFYLHGPDRGSTPDLRELDLASGNSKSVLPGLSLRDYDVSPDEKEVAFTVTPGGSEPQIWVASLDRQSPPREITRGGTQVSFARNGALVYRLNEKKTSFLYRIDKDGSGRERLVNTPIIEKGGVSPDGEWVVATKAATGEGSADGVPQARTETVAIPLRGGPPRLICPLLCRVSWSRDGKFLQIGLRAAQSLADRDTTLLIPVPPGQALPDLPDAGIVSGETLKLPGARAIDENNVQLAPDGSSYLFVRQTGQRNLFRITMK